jgi:hypothetical protein
MGGTVKAKAGDTLCGLALRNGFPHCEELRALAANAAFRDGPLAPGDLVTIPDKKTKKASGETGKAMGFVVSRGPAPSIRFVHGSRYLPYQLDRTLRWLDISNFVSERAGAAQGAPFPGGHGFDPDGDADPDSFKVEVVTPGAGATLTVLLEALRPTYGRDGSVKSREPFAGAEHDARKLDAECRPVSGRSSVFRSRYLRLVTDDVDRAAIADRALLVTDAADGSGGDDDRVEILDQRVRASVVIPVCKAPAGKRCTLRAELPVGRDNRRIRLCAHVFRATPGGAPTGGLTERMVRRRIQKWFRRAYAQAGLAPRIVPPGIEFIDPPAANMLVLSQDSGLRASGLDASGAASTVTFRLGSPPPLLLAWLLPGNPTVRVVLRADMTPTQVGAAIAAALPAGYLGEVFTNARGFTAADPSCDVLVSRADGKRVIIREETTTDTRLTVAVARVDLSNVDDSSSPNLIPTTAAFRRILRSAPGADDRLDYFMVDRFRTFDLRGRAFIAGTDLAPPFRPPAPLRWAVVMAARSSSGAVLDGGDTLPFTFPHEAGHVLTEAFHTTGANSTTEMMRSGTSAANAVDASKRICDSVHVQYGMFDPGQPTPGASHTQAFSAVRRVRARGGPVLERW